MATIIRLEHPKTGKGVYTSYGEKTQDLQEILKYKFAQDEIRHPTPTKDSLLVANLLNRGIDIEFRCLPERFVFGFANKEQCRAWFFSDVVLQLIHECGFKLYEIESEKVVFGNTQVCVATDEIDNKTAFDVLEYFGLEEININFISDDELEELLKVHPPAHKSSYDLCVDLALEEYEQLLKKNGAIQPDQFFPYELSYFTRQQFIRLTVD